MKTMISLIKKDFLNAVHDQIMVMMIVMPIVMAVILKLLIPSIENPEIKVYIGPGIDSRIEERLKEFYIVERIEDLEKMKDRINEYGDNPGIYYEDSSFKIIFQGDEPEEYKDSLTSVLNYIETDDVPELKVKSLNKEKSVIGEIIGAAGLLLITGIAGMIMGFSIVEDKDSRVNEAISVSPVNINQYLISKIAYLVLYSLFFSLICWFIIFGTGFDITSFFLTFICSLLLSIFLAFFIGSIADNQNKAIAISKISMFVFLLLPVMSMIVPENYDWLFYPLPGYWILKLLINSILNIHKDYYFIFSVALVYNFVIILAMIPFMRGSMKMRMR